MLRNRRREAYVLIKSDIANERFASADIIEPVAAVFRANLVISSIPEALKLFWLYDFYVIDESNKLRTTIGIRNQT